MLATNVLSDFTRSTLVSQHSDSIEELEDCSRLLTSLMNPHSTLFTPTTSMSPIFCLTVLATIAGGASYGGNSLLNVSWKRDLLELGLHRWLNACQLQRETQLSTITLFHLIFINIRTNLELVHKFAKWQTSPCDGISYLTELRLWQSSDDCEIAILHAKDLVEVVKHSFVFSFGRHSQSGTSTPSSPTQSGQTNQNKLAEVPHLANSVYMATLVLWTHAVVRKKPDWVLGRSVLENGILTLSCFGVRVATKLGNILRCLNNSRAG
jgi:hypothetical protein